MQKLAVIVACGGISKRFGEDKTAQMLEGETLLDRSVRIAKKYGGSIALAARSDAVHGPGDIPLLIDEQPEIGPISALASGFDFAEQNGCSHILLLACDQPFLPADLADRLEAAIGDAGVAMPISADKDQNMAALWRCDRAALQEYIAGGGRSLWKFAEQVGKVRVEWDECGADPFADIDDRSQLAAAEKRLNEE